MKILRTLGLIFTKLGLSIGIMCLLLSYILGEFIISSFTTALVVEESTAQILESSGIDSGKLDKIISSKEAKELIDKYINPFLNDEHNSIPIELEL